MATNKQVVLDQIYKMKPRQRAGSVYPSFSVDGTDETVNVYFFIKSNPSDSAPTLISEMVPDDANAYPIGLHSVFGNADYIVFEKESGSGTPVIKTKNLIEE